MSIGWLVEVAKSKQASKPIQASKSESWQANGKWQLAHSLSSCNKQDYDDNDNNQDHGRCKT